MLTTTVAQTQITSAREVLVRVAERTLFYDLSVWFWGDAIAVDGLLDASEILEDAGPREHCLNYYERWARRPLTCADHLTPGLALLRLYKEHSHEWLLEAARRLAEWLIAEPPRAPRSGAPLYRPDLPPYRHTVWIDTIYHEPSFFCSLAEITGEERYYEDGMSILNSHIEVLSTLGQPFLAHAYDTGAKLLRGYGWGRGNGWALYGILDTIELLPDEHPQRKELLLYFNALCDAVLSVQDCSGFWRTLLHDREAYLESSTASFFGAVFTKAIRLGLLDERFGIAAERAWRAMLSRVAPDGGFYGVSACTYAAVSPGDDVTMYRTLPTEVNVWGQGSALRFAAERVRSGLN